MKRPHLLVLVLLLLLLVSLRPFPAEARHLIDEEDANKEGNENNENYKNRRSKHKNLKNLKNRRSRRPPPGSAGNGRGAGRSVYATTMTVGGPLKRDIDASTGPAHPPLQMQSPRHTYVMFWRPQKVGSSTLLSLLISYGFRYNVLPRPKSYKNSFCVKIAACAQEDMRYDNESSAMKTFVAKSMAGRQARAAAKDVLVEGIPYQLSINHELCNFNDALVYDNLKCAFYGRKDAGFTGLGLHNVDMERNRHIKEIFAVRDPLSRMISVYYFWGELFKLHRAKQMSKRQMEGGDESSASLRLGAGKTKSLDAQIIQHSLFTYHGNESSVPSDEIAMIFADKFPLTRGMPGPSFTWSAFANSADAAALIVNPPKSTSQSNSISRMLTIVTERLDESLVAMAHYLEWTIADVVATALRKAQSTHPKSRDWPATAVDRIKKKLVLAGEYQVYDAAVIALDTRLNDLRSRGVPIDAQVRLLKQMRTRVSNVCHNDDTLQRYKTHLSSLGLHPHISDNRLRDSDHKYADGGHLFSYLGELLMSYDLCGSCEAHALQLGVLMRWSGRNVTRQSLSETHVQTHLQALQSITDEEYRRRVSASFSHGNDVDVTSLPLINDIPQAILKEIVHFKKCPID